MSFIIFMDITFNFQVLDKCIAFLFFFRRLFMSLTCKHVRVVGISVLLACNAETLIHTLWPLKVSKLQNEFMKASVGKNLMKNVNSKRRKTLISDMPVVHSVQSDLSNVSSVSEEWTRKISFPANAALRTNYSRASVLLPYYSTSIYLRQLIMLSADKNSLVL